MHAKLPACLIKNLHSRARPSPKLQGEARFMTD
jgi:hypothetical protein